MLKATKAASAPNLAVKSKLTLKTRYDENRGHMDDMSDKNKFYEERHVGSKSNLLCDTEGSDTEGND